MVVVLPNWISWSAKAFCLLSGYLKTLKETLAAYSWWARVKAASECGSRKRFRGTRNKHLLLLAWSFPPSVNGGVYRPTALVKYGSDLGWRISVLSGPIGGVPGPAGVYLIQSLPEQLRIERVKPTKLVPSWTWFPRVDGGFLNALAAYTLAEKLFKNDPPSVVMASAPKFHTFVAAYYIAKLYRAKLVLDYRDEWTECPFDFVQKGNADRRWETHCLQKADAVFFTTQSQLDHQVSVFSKLNPCKCVVIPNGWEPKDFVEIMQCDERSCKLEEKIIISFIGNLGRHTLPSQFLFTLENVLSRREDLRRNIRIRFVGSKVPEAVEQLCQFPYRDVLDLYDPVSKPLAIRMMQNSSALLLINDGRLARYIPGKLYEYLAAGPPILCFGNTGEICDIITKLDRGIIVPMGEGEALESALNLLVTGSSYRQDRKRTEQWLNAHTRENMARRIIEVLDSLGDR